MPSLKAVLLGLMAASTTLAGPIVRPGSVDVRRTVAPRDSNMADSIAVSLPDPVMDEQEDQVATAKSELGDDESGGFEALQSRATQPRKGGTRISNGGRSRGRGTTTISTTNGLNIPQGTKLNPGILQAISPPPLPVSSGRRLSGIILDRGFEELQSRGSKQKGKERENDKEKEKEKKTRPAGTGDKQRGGGGKTTSTTTTTFKPRPERLSPDIIAQISRPPPIEVTSTRKIPDSILGPAIDSSLPRLKARQPALRSSTGERKDYVPRKPYVGPLPGQGDRM